MRSVVTTLALLLVACSGTSPETDGGSDTYDCDPQNVACDGIPPECPSGFVASVDDACWGPCVEQLSCERPIPCSEAEPECPDGWGCLPTGECAPPR